MKLKIMTFNLRTDTPVDGINQFFLTRKDRVLEAIRTEDADIIGFQEARDNMRAWLYEVLPPLGYRVEGCGRDADYRGESTVIAVKLDKFQVTSVENRWLSFTPHVPGSRFGRDQSSCPRILTAAVLKPTEGRPFLFVNTHLDHKGSTARLLGAVSVMQYVAEQGLHFAVTGDMNALPDSPEIYAFTDAEPAGRPVKDATRLLGGTFHGFGKRPGAEMSKIDYVFTDMPCDEAESYMLSADPVDGVYISDHCPVVAFVETEE